MSSFLCFFLDDPFLYLDAYFSLTPLFAGPSLP
jgi:hypothetical protein